MRRALQLIAIALAVMLVPALAVAVLFPPYGLGVLSAAAMALAMLHRREEHRDAHHAAKR